MEIGYDAIYSCSPSSRHTSYSHVEADIAKSKPFLQNFACTNLC